MNYANLHLHSIYSDGGFQPMHLVRIAKCLGYKALVLTDHDVMNGIPELMEEAAAEDMRVMTGMELCGFQDGVCFHIVALGFDMGSPSLAAHVDGLCRDRSEYTKKQFERAIETGVLGGLTWEDVMTYSPDCKWYCNDQVYYAIDRMGLQGQYGKRKTFKEAFQPLSYPLMQVELAETLRQIHGAGGVSVLAHPQGQLRHVPALAEMGLMGIEVCHPLLDEANSTEAARLAAEYGLYRSGGSDHTGALSGCYGRECVEALHGVSKEDFDAITERKLSK